MRARTVRDRWEAEVLRSGRIGDACRVLLMLMARQMSDTGMVAAKREDLAETIGRHPQRVAERIAEARSAGLLDLIAAGKKGHPAEYSAVIPAAGLRTDLQYAIDRKRTGLRYAKSVRNPRSDPADSERVPIEKDSASVSEHVAVNQHRERRDDHDGNRASLDHVLIERRSNEQSPRFLALAAAFSCERPSEAA